MRNIEILIDEIYTFESKMCRESVFSEKQVDKYLDNILLLKHSITEITITIEDLTEKIHDYFNVISPDDYRVLKPLLEKTDTFLAVIFFSAYREVKAHNALDTLLSELYNSISNFKEVKDDLEMAKVRLPKNERFKQLMNAAKKK